MDHAGDLPKVLVVVVHREEKLGMVPQDVVFGPLQGLLLKALNVRLIMVMGSGMSVSKVVTGTAAPVSCPRVLEEALVWWFTRDRVPSASPTPFWRHTISRYGAGSPGGLGRSPA